MKKLNIPLALILLINTLTHFAEFRFECLGPHRVPFSTALQLSDAHSMLREADCSREEAEEIYKLTSLCTFEDRFVIPPMHREEAIEMMKDPQEHRAETGFGFVGGPRRGA